MMHFLHGAYKVLHWTCVIAMISAAFAAVPTIPGAIGHFFTHIFSGLAQAPDAISNIAQGFSGGAGTAHAATLPAAGHAAHAAAALPADPSSALAHAPDLGAEWMKTLSPDLAAQFKSLSPSLMSKFNALSEPLRNQFLNQLPAFTSNGLSLTQAVESYCM